jgi:MFS family permease
VTAICSNIFGNISFTGVNIAAPALERSLGLSAVQIGWLLLSCLLAMAAFSAPVARLSEIWGRRKLSVWGMWIAIIGSAGSALAQGATFLLITRAVTGIGLVTFFTTVTTMVAEAYPKEERGKVLGLVIGSVYVSLSVGPLVAGFLVEHWGWEALFWFSSLSLLPPLALLYRVKGEDSRAAGEKMNIAAFVLWALGIAFAFTGLASIGVFWALPALVGGAVLIVGFLWVNSGSSSPLLDMSLFTGSRRFSFSSLAAYISYLGSFSITPLLSLYFQYSKGFSPALTGVLLVAQPLVQAAITPYSGKLSDRHDAGKLSALGLAVILAGIVLLAVFLGEETPIALIIVAMSLCGAGFALFGAPNSNAIMSSVPPRRIGQASGVITVTRLTGQITSIAVTTLIFSKVIGSGEVTPELYPLFIDAARILFAIFAPLCLIGVFASLSGGQKTKERP